MCGFRTTRLASRKRLDVAVIGKLVAELNDLGDAAEVLDQSDGAPEGLSREVIDRSLAVVEMGIWNSLQELIDQVLHDGNFLADGGGTDLFVIAYDDDARAKV